MSAPVERCIEHVRRQLAVRSGIQITSQNVTAHSVSTPHPLYLPLPRPIINERLWENKENNNNNGGREKSLTSTLQPHQNKQTKELSALDTDGRFVKALQWCHHNVL